MPRLRHTVEQLLAKLREAEVALSKGQTVVQVRRSLGITEQAPFEGVTAARLTRLAS
jgi:hypothetical protein